MQSDFIKPSFFENLASKLGGRNIPMNVWDQVLNVERIGGLYEGAAPPYTHCH